jgi:CRP-like cAMP-binding protein
VKSGSIRVTLVSEEGREVVLYRVRPGEICLQTFACLSRGATYAAEGVVETPVDGVLIPPAQFQKLVSESGAFRSAVFEAIAARFSEFEHVVETLAFTGIESRVASALLLLAGDGHLVTATHHDIATEIGSGAVRRHCHEPRPHRDPRQGQAVADFVPSCVTSSPTDGARRPILPLSTRTGGSHANQ